MKEETPPTPPSPAVDRRSAKGTIVALVMIVLGIIGAYLVNKKRQTVAEGTQRILEASRRRAEDLPHLSRVADFALIERSGKPVTTGDLLGRVWVAEYFFTYCGRLCPRMNRNFAALHRDFTGADEPKFVSITCDPMRDTLTAIDDHARTLQADTNRWWFMTGEEKELQKVAHSLLLTYEIGVPDSHSSKFVLVDRNGEMRGAYDGLSDDAMLELRRDLKLLLAAPVKD